MSLTTNDLGLFLHASLVFKDLNLCHLQRDRCHQKEDASSLGIAIEVDIGTAVAYL